LGLLYWATHGTTKTRGLLPIAWYSRDPVTGSGSNALLPLFFEKHSVGQRTLVTLPFGYRSAPDRRWWYAGPVAYRDTPLQSFAMVFPLWFNHFDKVTETNTRVVPPLLHFSRSRPDRSLSGWLGLFWRHESLTSSTTLALPLFFDRHSFHESRTTVLFPLFLRHRAVEDDTTVTIAPLFYRRTSTVNSTTIAFPVVWDWSSASRGTTIVFPLLARFRRPNWTATFVVPNIYYRRGTGTDEGTYRLFVFPLWESAVKRKGDFMWEAVLGLVGFESIGRNRFLKLFFIPFELEPAPPAQTAWYGRAPARPRSQRAQGVNTQVW
jgi:hypothetical protein